MAWQNPDDDTIARLLRMAKSIAVVGCSPDPERTSHQIAQFLIDHGYRIYPVNPRASSIFGLETYADLASIPEQVDIVDVFRRAEYTPDIARQAVAAKAGALWLQQGIVNEQAYHIATEGGLDCVMDRCIAVMHRLLLR